MPEEQAWKNRNNDPMPRGCTWFCTKKVPQMGSQSGKTASYKLIS